MFHGNSAVVGLTDSVTGYDFYALIDKKVTYITPPSRHWNGTWSGWKGHLNSFDEKDNWGQTDTQKRLQYRSNEGIPLQKFNRIVFIR